jgi:hypothetical protein
VSAALEPADERVFAVALKRMADFAKAFNLPPLQVDSAVPFYREYLGKLPPDLLLKAVENVLGTWKWGNRLPMPGDILAAAKDEMSARQLTRLKLETAIQKHEPPRAKEAPRPVAGVIAAATRAVKPPRYSDPTPAELEAEKRRQLAEVRDELKESRV